MILQAFLVRLLSECNRNPGWKSSRKARPFFLRHTFFHRRNFSVEIQDKICGRIVEGFFWEILQETFSRILEKIQKQDKKECLKKLLDEIQIDWSSSVEKIPWGILEAMLWRFGDVWKYTRWNSSQNPNRTSWGISDRSSMELTENKEMNWSLE